MATQIQQPRPSSTGQSTTGQQQAKSGGSTPSPAPSSRTKWRGVAWATKTLRGQFIIQAAALLVIAVTLGLIAQGAFRQAHDDLNTMVVESAPSIDAAQAMEQYLHDIDAKAADFLATTKQTNLVSCKLPVTQYQPGDTTVHECDFLTINADITLFNQELYKAAHNVTFPGEQTAVQRITTGFEEYTSDIARMEQEYWLAADPNNLQDEHIQRAHQAYNSASNVMQLHISNSSALDTRGLHTYNEENVPSCVIQDPLGNQELLSWEWPNRGLEVNIDCLGAINKAQLDTAYDGIQNTLTGMLVLLILFSLVLCAWLVVVTVRMMLITHRVINPGLTVAMLLAIILCIPLLSNYSALGGRHGVFGEIVKDDYYSVYYAADLNRYATAARADETHWLIALQDGDQPQVDRWTQDWQNNKRRVRLLIAQAIENRTWPEEGKPLATMQDEWGTYEAIDDQLRSTAQVVGNPQRFDEAERLSTGASNQTFGTFTSAVDRLSTAKRNHFESSYNGAASTTTADAMWAIVLFPIIGLLAVAGVWLRLKDF